MCTAGRQEGKIFEVAVENSTYLLMIGGSEQGDPLPCPRVFLCAQIEIFTKVAQGVRVFNECRIPHKFRLRGLVFILKIVQGEGGDTDAAGL